MHSPDTFNETENQETPRRQLLSIVLPAYNEAAVIPHTYRRLVGLEGTFASLGLDYELVFVNDGSRDDTASALNALAATDGRVRIVHLTRNFGHQAAVTAGLSVARGHAVVIMDCDLQDPPEVLPDLIAPWRAGCRVVYAVRRKRKEWFGKRAAYWLFYRLLTAISDLDMPLDSGDFCLLDRQAVDLLNSLPEHQRFVRGLRTWVGLRQMGVEYERAARHAGQPAYTWRGLVKLAVDGLISFSSVPLKLVTKIGIVSAAFSLVLMIYVAAGWLLDSRTPRGWASLAGLVLLTSSVQLLSLGIIGEYLARIFLEVKGRPTFLIAEIVEDLAEPGAAGGESGSTNPGGRKHSSQAG